MICSYCHSQQHCACPEIARQADPGISDLDKIGSAWCYCAHQEGSSLRPPGPQVGY